MSDPRPSDPRSLETDPVDAATEPRPRSREHWVLLALVAGIAVGLWILGAKLTPDPNGYGTHEQLGLQPCMPMQLWNVPCPGCGVTTSVSLAAHGDFLASARNQPFGFLVALFFAAVVVWAPIATLLGRDLWRDLQSMRYGLWAKVLIAFVALSWIYKLVLVRGWFGL